MDAAARSWKVYEMDAPTYDRRGGRVLVFECFELIRKVRTFPANWHQLPDSELLALSESV